MSWFFFGGGINVHLYGYSFYWRSMLWFQAIKILAITDSRKIYWGFSPHSQGKVRLVPCYLVAKPLFKTNKIYAIRGALLMTPPRFNTILAVVILTSGDSKARMTLSRFFTVWCGRTLSGGPSVPVIPFPTGLEILIELTLWELVHFLRRTCFIIYSLVTIWLLPLWSIFTMMSWQFMRSTNTLFPYNSNIYARGCSQSIDLMQKMHYECSIFQF